jgi:hypothetical protein
MRWADGSGVLDVKANTAQGTDVQPCHPPAEWKAPVVNEWGCLPRLCRFFNATAARGL